MIHHRWSKLPEHIEAAVLAFDFFFVPPYGTFAVADARHFVVFAVMLVIALVSPARQSHQSLSR